VRPQRRVELVEDDAGLDGCRHRVAIEIDQSSQVLAVVDDERRADRLAALRAAGAARKNRNAKLAADRHCRGDVVVARGNEHADRLDLIDRRVGRVAAARSGIEQHAAFDRAA
jgi:hypothetical protein